MGKVNRVQWVEVARRGKTQPLLFIDSFIECYRHGYFGRAHRVAWNPRRYRQFDNARWFGGTDAEAYQAVLEKAARGGAVNLATYGKEYARRIRAFRVLVRRQRRRDFASLPNQQLADTFGAFFEHTKHFWAFGYNYIFINRFLPDIVTAAIAAKVRDVGELNRILGILFAAARPSEVRLEKRALVKIAATARRRRSRPTDPAVVRQLRRHLRTFAHLGFYYFRGEPYTLKSLQERLREYLRLPAAKFRQLRRDFAEQDRNTERTRTFVRQLRLEPQIVKYIWYLRQWGALSNEVDETYSYAVHALWPLWREICRRLEITYPEFYSLTAGEITQGLKRGRLTPSTKAAARARHRDHAIILEGKRKRILVGSALDVYRRQERREEVKVAMVREFRGQAASPGRRRGRVRIIFTTHDVKYVERGNILVAVATNPTYVPAMERAAAIVTDEGGLLSHAAIVSRELGIPCVVGARVATKVLKNGYLVEVDADRGVVRVLKRR